LGACGATEEACNHLTMLQAFSRTAFAKRSLPSNRLPRFATLPLFRFNCRFSTTTHLTDHSSEEWTPSLKEWQETGKRKPSKYPVPPVADTAGLVFYDDCLNPEKHPELPWTIDRSEGVTVLKYKVGPYKDEELVLAQGSFTLEWAESSPPPLHQMEEPPLIKEHPDYVHA